jgi:N-methylhydantoinase A/acetone carboxylase, beta subunit
VKCKVAIDIGGTFTDFIILSEVGEVSTIKFLTNPRNPGEVIQNVIKGLNCEVEEVVHATTLATNALLGQENLNIPRTALLTTKGFRDVIEIGRQNRPRLYDLYFEKPNQIVPRELRIEVDERVNADGEILKEVDEIEVVEKVSKIKAEAVAVSYLHSYINPHNELKTKRS